MKILSGLDNLFLNQETTNQHMHVAGLGIYDQSTAIDGNVRFKTILDFFTSRLRKSPVFGRRLVFPPMGIDRPYWVEGENVDIEYHVRHLGLPHPGDWRQLMIQIARIHSRPLDLTKPLWEAYVIEGLDNIPNVPKNSFALYIKFHHAAIDGEMGAQVVAAIHSLTAEFDPKSLTNSSPIIIDREPSNVEMVARAVGHRASQVVDTTKLVIDLGKNSWKLGQSASGQTYKFGKSLFQKYLGSEESKEEASHKRPFTRFNNSITPHRVVDAVALPLKDFKTIRNNVEKVTINDIFLTVVGGAMMKYLKSKNEIPKTSLITSIPMSIRTVDSDTDSGNQIAQMSCSLRTEITDPVKRLIAVNTETSTLKHKSNLLGKDFQKRLLDILPASLIAKPLTRNISSSANVNISNVRGPDKSLYLAGAKLQMFMPVSIPIDGLGLNITGFSYNGMMWVTLTSCRTMLPDPSVFSQFMKDEFNDLVEAAISQEEETQKEETTV